VDGTGTVESVGKEASEARSLARISVSDDMPQKLPRSPVIRCRCRILSSDIRSFPPQSWLEPSPAIREWKARLCPPEETPS
jgi:hypothetical protein